MKNVVNKADSTGLVSATKAKDSGAKPPPITKEVIEWLAKGRIHDRDQTASMQNELQKSRYELMSIRQSGLSKQIDVAKRLGDSMMRDFADTEPSRSRIEYDVSIDFAAIAN